MTVVAGSGKRDAVPRWRDLRATIENGEIGIRGDESTLDERSSKELRRSRSNWERDRSQIKAAEFVSTGLVLGVPSQVQDAVSELLEQQLPPSLRRLVSVVSEENSSKTVEKEASALIVDDLHLYVAIAELKRALVREPRRPLIWLELARQYSQLGQLEPASTAISRALVLAPNNRYVLRSAAAFFTNLGDGKRAHSILANSDRAASDPWLVAAELATASQSNEKPIFARRGLAMLEDENFGEHAISELSVQLATMDVRGGRDRRARRMVSLALVNPTENSVAQVESLSSMDKSIELPPDSLELPSAYEARAKSSLEEGKWIESIESAELWLADQPFSSDAAVFGSYAALSGMRDNSLALAFATRGLKANPHDAGLMNNAAVAAIEMFDLEAAGDLLRRASECDASRQTQIALRATLGLLEFRSGSADVGRAYYEEAIRLAQGEKVQTQHVLASIMLAREEIRSRTPMAGSAMQRAERLLKRTESKIVKSWWETIEKDFEKLQNAPR
jgi:tetratricopeptide (TPR) repeat protein